MAEVQDAVGDGLVLVEAGPAGSNQGVVEGIAGWFASWPVPFPSREAAVRFPGGGPVGEGRADGLAERDGGWWPRSEPVGSARSRRPGRQRGSTSPSSQKLA